MTYLLKSKPKKSYGRLLFVLVVLIVLSLLSFVFPDDSRSLLYTAGRPVWLAKEKIAGTFSPLGSFFSSRAALEKRNAALEEENASLRARLLSYEGLLAENESLRTQLGRPASQSKISARVLSKPPVSPYDSFVVDAGLSSGVSAGDLVYFSDTVAAGTVESATDQIALVSLFSSAGKKPATLLRTGATYEIAGAGAGNFTLEVPKDADVVWGDLFTYAARPEAVLGSVYYIDTASQSSFKTIHLRAPGNIFQTKWVFIEPTTLVFP